MREIDHPAPEAGPENLARALRGRSSLWLRQGLIHASNRLRRRFLSMRYSPDLLIAVTLIVGLNVLDAVFTLIIIDEGGKELNPIVRSAIDVWGEGFWVWKFTLVSFNVLLLCLFSHFKYVKAVIFGICSLYLVLVMYQVALLNLIGS